MQLLKDKKYLDEKDEKVQKNVKELSFVAQNQKRIIKFGPNTNIVRLTVS